MSSLLNSFLLVLGGNYKWLCPCTVGTRIKTTDTRHFFQYFGTKCPSNHRFFLKVSPAFRFQGWLVQFKVWYLKCVSFPDHYLKLKHRSQCHISSAHPSAAHILKPHEYLVSFLGAAHDPKLTKALSPPTSLSPDEPTHIWKELVHTSECLNSVSLLKLYAVRG